MDQVKRRGRALANKCYLCEEDEETIEYFLVRCESQDALGSLFVDCWDKLGFSKFGPSHSTIMARSNNGEKTKKNLVGSPPFLILDFMVGKKYGSV